MFGPNYGAAQSHIEELMKEREDFIQASKAQARRVAELEASLAAATELHEAAQEQLEVQSLIAEHRATRIHELEEETRAQANTMGKLREAVHLLWGLLGKVQSLTSDGSAVLEELDGMLGGGPPPPAGKG